MRGLRLLVRSIETADHDAVRQFLERQDCPISVPTLGLLGKLLGDIVAIVALDPAGESLRIVAIIVDRRLRKVRIGRAMMRDVEALASRSNYDRVVVDEVRDAGAFFQRLGFEDKGHQWVRTVQKALQQV